MKNFNYDFESKIKFYFSLIFTSINDYEVLTEIFGEDINIFNKDNISQNFPNMIDSKIIDNIIWNYKKIELQDKTILRLFTPYEVENYYNVYSSENSSFNLSDPEKLEEFYIYMLLSKVKEKKRIEYGTIYDLFDTFLDEEIIKAVANLDFEDKKTFIDLFGVKGDLPFEINSNNHIRNDILIKLYSYMLLKRDEADIPSIIRNIISKEAYEYTFYDYIRNLCGDKDLTNEFIFEMLSKMDYNSKKSIKDIFGENLDKKRKPPKEKAFKKSIENLVVIVKVNKEYRKRKENEFKYSKKKKAGFEEKKKESNKEEKKKDEKQPQNENVQEKKDKETKEKKKDQIKPKDKIKNEKKIKKNDDKKSRLSNFLLENGIEKSDFLKAVELLDPFSKKVVELYYGLKKDPIELESISEKLSKEVEEILDILDSAEKKIVELIKTGKINKSSDKVVEKKKEVSKKISADNKLKSLMSSGKLSAASLNAAMSILDPVERIVVDSILASKDNSFKEIALNLNIKEENAKSIYEVASAKIISNLNLEEKKEDEVKENEEEKEEKKESLEEPKEEIPKQEENKKKENNSKGSSLDEFLKETGLTKEEFFDGFKKLDPFSKKIISAYLGLYSSSLSVEKIAKNYGLREEEVKKIISSAKQEIIKSVPKVEKIDLNEFLKENGMSKNDFTEALEGLIPAKRNLLKQYFGIGTAAIELKELARKYGTDVASINNMVKNNLKEVAEINKNKKKDSGKKDNDLSDKLNKFLTVNNISREKFFAALELLPAKDKNLVSMYFGINCNEMSIPSIALATKTNPITVKSDLSSILRQINTLAKSKNLNELSLNQRYQALKLKLNKTCNRLVMDGAFLTLIGSNPMFINLLSVITNLNVDINQASKMLGISTSELMNNLMSFSMICDDYINNSVKQANNGFKDDDSMKNKSVGRNY